MIRKKIAAVVAVSLSIATLVGCSAGTGQSSFAPSSVTGAFDWKRYSGTSLNVILSEHPWTTGIKAHLKEFEDLTGITVNVQSYTENLYLDKMAQSVRSSESPDVYMLYEDDAVVNQFSANLVEPLTPYLENPSLTDPGYDLSDFPDGLLTPAQLPAGDANSQLYEIPISTETYIMYYNKDLVDKYLDGKVPTTMAELITAAKKITAAGGGDVFGSVMRGVRSDSIKDTLTGIVLNEVPATTQVQSPYNVWFDGSWSKPQLDDKYITAGLSDYAELLNQGPANKLNLDWPDAVSLFQQGKAAFYLDSSPFGPGFEDPSASQVAGRVGYAQLPTGSVQGTSGVWSWALAMSAHGKNKGAAWLFEQWATGKQITAEVGKETGGAPRQSAFQDAAYTSSFNADYLDVVTKSLATARTTAVLKDNWKPGALVIIDAMLAIANGKEPAEAVQSANDTMKQTIQ